jgi:L-histidine N-alpha-methyltransferase
VQEPAPAGEPGAPLPRPRVTVEVHLDSGDPRAALDELRASLGEEPPRLPSKYFYDDRGSELFERITELPEYYQTRTEAAILAGAAGRIAALTGAEELVELGSGAATKTRLLLDAMAHAGRLRLYVPLDFSEGTLRRAAAELVAEYPGLAVHGVVGDFLEHLGELPPGRRRLVIFLGGTIGNLGPEREREFLREVRDAMGPGDWFLLGTDLIKDPAVIEAAYNDAAGVTAEFNRNILRVVNEVAGGDFDPERFAHRAFWDAPMHRIEMRLVAASAQTVRLAAIPLTLTLAAGEEISTEISTKYDRAMAADLLAGAGFRPIEWFTDPGERFGLTLAARD